MKRISRRTLDKFMRAFLNASEQNRMPLVDSGDPLLNSLRKRCDFAHAIEVLVSMGFLAADPYNHDHPRSYIITESGRCYFEKRASENSERRWSRGLAIAAILISLLALMLEFDDRGYLDWAKPEKTHAAQSIPVISESQ